MKRLVKQFSGDDMLEAFKLKLAELEASPITSTTWIDPHGLFGEINGVYTDEDLREYWDQEHESDWVLMSFSNFDDWYNATVADMEEADDAEAGQRININSATDVPECSTCDTYRVYEINKETGERIPLAGGSDFISLYYAKLAALSARAYEIQENGFCNYSFEIECISNGVTQNTITASTKVTANREDGYFGEVMSKKYGQQICDALTGQTISKRRDLVEEPGGLVYEANKLGIDMWDLLEALEGMCADGRASEIDDSTYKIRGGQPHPVRGLFGATDEFDGPEEPSGSVWEEIASKPVPDSDGFMTEYTMYYNMLEDRYAFMFGDRDVYGPEGGWFDWECDSEEEAWDWYNSYTGFTDDDVMSSTAVTASTDAPEVVSWLADHDQAYEDACNHFGTDDLNSVSLDDLLGWISEHTQLAEDFVAMFGPIPE